MGKITETRWSITAPDGATIYGVLNQGKTPSKRAIFMVHGLTGHMYEYQFKYTADLLAAKYDVYRFDLYGAEIKARKLLDCTIATHAADLACVVAHFASQYDQIFLAGHSYGGTTIMLANISNITAVSLWDPSFDLTRIAGRFAENGQVDSSLRVMDWGVARLISQKMQTEAYQLNHEACVALSEKFISPIQVIHAGEAMYVRDGYSYHSFCPQQKDYAIIDGASHMLCENDSADRLVQETKRWFDQF